MNEHDVEDLLPHMRHVLSAERDLHEQTLTWSLIEASSAIGCPVRAESLLPTLSATRLRFGSLQRRLVGALARENIGALGDELGEAGQCTIDILVRNLFERTADVGFLATDAVLRDFCLLDAAARAGGRAALLARLREYRAKYSVYDDVIVLAPDGEVLARLDEDAPAGLRCTDPFVGQALARGGYVEYHGRSSLGADDAPALLYAHRIDSGRGGAAGVLVLRFRFADEMKRIFEGMAGARTEIALVLIDDQGRVVLSNDDSHVPAGASLRPVEPGAVRLTTFAGREYLAMRCPARPYQGYPGPGWHAQAMVSLLVAFRSQRGLEAKAAVTLRNDEMRSIRGEVEAINRSLRRVVWSGRLMAENEAGTDRAGTAALKAVLHQVTLAGARMRDRVGGAIHDLYRTALARTCRQAQEIARLAAELMDRNLYERANDCRWWALSPALREGLAQPELPGSAEAMARTLREIHALYTVYRRLVVFDEAGIVRASSLPEDEATLLGQPIEQEWCRQILALSDSQRYAVSGYEATRFSDGEASYVYLARIVHPQGGRAVGGIAIVFHAEREFSAMLTDVLGSREGVAAFVDAQGRMLACTEPSWRRGAAGGDRWPVALNAELAEHEDSHHAQGVALARGYREFKRDDGYDNGVRAVVLLRLGRVERRRRALFDQVLQVASRSGSREGCQELALFQVGPSRYALPSLQVREACGAEGLVRLQRGPGFVVGLVAAASAGGAMLPVLCARRLLGAEHPAREGDGLVLVLADPADPGRAGFGLMVDDVNAVLDIPAADVQEMPAALRQSAPWLRAVVRVLESGTGAEARAERTLVQLLDVAPLRRLVDSSGPATVPATA
jgi:chemotaxis signal transduction protein